jgi:hypothetical protein
MRRGAALAASTALALGLAGAARPTTTVVPYTPLTLDSPAPEPQPAGLGGGFGVQTVSVGDIDKDGVGEVLVASSGQDVSGLSGVGRVWVFDGAKRSVLATLDDPYPQAGASFGLSSAALGDVNADGYPDLAVAAEHQNVDGNAGQGKLFVFSGRTGQLLYARNDPDPQPDAEFGRTVLSPGDLNGDGIPDLIVGAPRENDSSKTKVGRVYAFSGKDGTLLYGVRAPVSEHNERFGLGLAAPGDLNGDHVPDFVVGAPRLDDRGLVDGGVAYAFSGKTGALLTTLRDPLPQAGAQLGLMAGAPGAPGDVNGDGVPDVLVPAPGHDASGAPGAGLAFLFSGKDGAPIRTLSDPTPRPGGGFGFAYASAGDLDHDGVPDTIVGQAPFLNRSSDAGGAYVFGGRSGSLLLSFEPPASQAGSDLGASLASPGDVNGDAHPDFFLGAPLTTVGANAGQGRVLALQSHDTTAPTVSAVRRLPGSTRRAPRYAFSASDPDDPASELSFRCSLDSRRLHACPSPYGLRLGRGRHVLRVRARDPAGNGSPIRTVELVVR